MNHLSKISRDLEILSRILLAQEKAKEQCPPFRAQKGGQIPEPVANKYTVVVLRPKYLADLEDGMEHAVMTLNIAATNPARAAWAAKQMNYIKDMQSGWAKSHADHYMVLAVFPGHIEPLEWD